MANVGTPNSRTTPAKDIPNFFYQSLLLSLNAPLKSFADGSPDSLTTLSTKSPVPRILSCLNCLIVLEPSPHLLFQIRLIANNESMW